MTIPDYLSSVSDASFSGSTSHASAHTLERDTINAIVEELGQAPQGQYASVQLRMNAIEARLGVFSDGSSNSSGSASTTNESYSSWPAIVRTTNGEAAPVSWWSFANLSSAGLYNQTALLYWDNGTLNAYNYTNKSQYQELSGAGGVLATAFGSNQPRAFTLTNTGELIIFARNGAIAAFSQAGGIQIRSLGHAGTRNLAFTNESFWSIESVNENAENGSAVDVVSRVRRTNSSTGDTALMEHEVGRNIDPITPPTLIASGTRLWISVADNATQPNARTIMYAETGADGSLSDWTTVLEDSMYRLVGADGGGGVYVIDVFGSAGEIFELDDDMLPTTTRTLSSSNVTWHDSMADGYNIIEHSGAVWIFTGNGTYKAYSTDRYTWFPPFFQVLEPVIIGGTTYVNVQTGFKALGSGWISAYVPDISEYPPRTLKAIWDSSPATPGAHSRDHSDARRALNAISFVLGANLRADYDSLQQRLDAIEQRLEMTSASSVEVDEYPPLPLDARTNQSPATPGAHSMDHTDERIAINAIARVLGSLPHGSKPSLQIRVEQAEYLSYQD